MGPHLLHVDLRELKKFERTLARTKLEAIPYATRASINGQAFEAQRTWREMMSERLTLRNAYTQRSIQVDQARTLDINKQQSAVGSVAKHVARSESGQKFIGRKKHGAPIPTLSARGGNPKALVRPSNKLKAIKLRPTSGKTPAQRNAIAIATARKAGRRFAFLDFGDSKGIYSVPKTRDAKLKRIWNLSHKSVDIAPRELMEQAASKARARGFGYYREALQAQLRRLGAR